MNPLLLWAPWPAALPVRALVTTRIGGLPGNPPFEGFNLGPTSGDEPERVAKHLLQLQSNLRLKTPIRLLKQIHGNTIVPDSDTNALPKADGWLVENQAQSVGIQTADCLQVALTRADGSKAALLHAGWKGLAAGILREGVELLQQGYSGDILAWVGPGIDAWAYQVQDDVRGAVLSKVPTAASCFQAHPDGGWFFDLGSAAEKTLIASGCLVSKCKSGTWSRSDLWYSWRKAQPTGRQLGVLWRL